MYLNINLSDTTLIDYAPRPYFFYYTPANFVCGGFTVFTLSVRPCVRPPVRPSVTFCFLNNSKSHCWIFIKPCKHVHICKTNTSDKKVRARGQFFWIISLCSSKRLYAYAIIGHTWADQLLPQLLMEQFDTFPIQCRHIEHMHEGVWLRKKQFLTKWQLRT